MPAINIDLLRRLKHEFQQAAAVHAGLAQTLIGAQQWEITCAGRLAHARQRLQFFPHGTPPAGMNIEDWEQARGEAQQRRWDAEDDMRRQFLRAGQAEQFAAHVAEMTRSDASDFQHAVAVAENDLAAASGEVARIIEAQATAAHRVGYLRGTLSKAREYLVSGAVEDGPSIVGRLRI